MGAFDAKNTLAQFKGLRMEEAELVKKYSEHIGAFWLNFSSLELILRVVLHKRSGGDTAESKLFPKVKEGDTLPATIMTNYDTFSQICNKFNATLKRNEKVDFSKIEMFRDALAHGRTTGDGTGSLSTIKYSKVSKGRVTVVFMKIHTLSEIDALVAEMCSLLHNIAAKHL